MCKRTNEIQIRNCNLDILRILSATGVIILHLNSFSNGGILENATFNSFNSVVAYFGESVFVCSVNIFLLISGYLLVDRWNIRLSKAIKLLSEVSILSTVAYILECILNRKIFCISDFFINMLPLNYYIILYVVLYLFSPFINQFIAGCMAKKKHIIFLNMYIIIFLLYPFGVTFLEAYLDIQLMGLSSIGIAGDQGGYTIINFIGMYLIGAIIKKVNVKIRKRYIIFGLPILWFIITIWKRYEDLYKIQSVSLNYNNPLIIITAILSFVLFLQINFKSNQIIENIAKAGSMVYLLQGYIIHFVNANSYANSNIAILLMRVMFIISIIWMFSMVVNNIFEWSFSKIKKLYFINKINFIGNCIYGENKCK